MGLSFSKSSTNTNANAGAENETTLQHLANSIRRSFRVKRNTANDANRSSLPSRSFSERQANPPTRVRPGIPDGFRQHTAASGSSTTASKGAVEHPAKPLTTSAEAKAVTPKTPEVAPAIASATEAPRNAAFLPQPTKEVKKDEEKNKEVDNAMDLLKGAILAGEEEGEKKDDKKVDEKRAEEKENLLHIGGILSQLAPPDTSNDKTPETDAPAKPAVSLMAALEKRKAMKEKEKEEEDTESEEDDEVNKDENLTPGVTNVLESIATQSISIRSKEAATLMAAFPAPRPASPNVKEEEQKEKKDKKNEEEDEEEDKKNEEEDEEEENEEEEKEHQKEKENNNEEEGDEKKEGQEDKEHRKEKEDEKSQKFEQMEHKKLAVEEDEEEEE